MNQETRRKTAGSGKAFFVSDYRRTSETKPYGEFVYSVEGLTEGDACFEMIPIRRGLSISVSHFYSGWDKAMDFRVAGAPLQFEYWLSGAGRCEMTGMGPSSSVIHCRAGDMSANYLPDTMGRCTSVSASEVNTVGLQIDPVLLHTLVGEVAADFPDLFRMTSDGEILKKFSVGGRVSPAMHAACHQILTCPFTGACRALYLESKALELLSLQADALTSSFRGTGRTLSRRDIDRIHEARDRLVADLKHPPTIARLARQTGINETKLKAGFRSVFGTTIFDYLRRHKMEMARTWLEGGEKNVSEAADDVGYANVSHFIRAYRTIFGVNPGAVARQSRGRGGLS